MAKTLILSKATRAELLRPANELPMTSLPCVIQDIALGSAGSDVIATLCDRGYKQSCELLTAKTLTKSAPYTQVFTQDMDFRSGYEVFAADRVVGSDMISIISRPPMARPVFHDTFSLYKEGDSLVEQKVIPGQTVWSAGLFLANSSEPCKHDLLLYDVNNGIALASKMRISDYSPNFVSTGVALEKNVALIGLEDNLYLADMRQEVMKQIPGDYSMQRMVVAGCKLFINNSNQLTSREEDGQLLKIIPTPNMPLREMWSVHPTYCQRSNSVLRVASMFSWSAGCGQLGVELQNYESGGNITRRLMIVNPRRPQIMCELPRSKSMIPFAPYSRPVHKFAPSHITGMPVILDIDMKTSRISVLV